ncbi:MAG: bifunctional tetrahydrofolate synthase/dihydrofolate synthase [Burkholderiaceae bacterium]
MTLAQWLERIERMHPTEIELGLERVRDVASRLAVGLSGVVFTVGGTNGKGSVCALLEAMTLHAGYRVGTYTSPHLLRFNERARINGEAVDDQSLVAAFEAVEAARESVSLTYFEFSTLAVLHLFAAHRLDVVILEVGLGGRLDAVNIVDADCAIVTCVDIDHVGFLGDTREAIGLEKAHIYRAGRPAICADPAPPRSLVAYAQRIGADLWLFGRDFNYAGDRRQWSFGGRAQRRNSLAYPSLRGANQLLNASGALAALEAMRDRLVIPQQAVRVGLANVELPGRFQVLPGRPTVVLDVAHNPHAAAHLAANLDNMGFFPYTYAVFGAMADKDIDRMLDALGERIDHWSVVDLPTPRAATASDLLARLRARGYGATGERTARLAPDPADALAQARELAAENDRIVVFGSFYTVAGALVGR